MERAAVYNNNVLAGYLEKHASDDYRFIYADAYLKDTSKPSISLALTKLQKEHHSNVLFPFFAGLLTEGINKDIQCRLLHIDEADDFTRLIATAGVDTIGAITVKRIID